MSELPFIDPSKVVPKLLQKISDRDETIKKLDYQLVQMEVLAEALRDERDSLTAAQAQNTTEK